MSLIRTFAILFAVVTLSAFGQYCGPNGGRAALTTEPMALGKTVDITVAGTPGATFFIFLSDGPGPTPLGAAGTACLTIASPNFVTLATGALPAGGSFTLPVVVPNDPALLNALLWMQALVTDGAHPSGVALSEGLRIEFENPNSYRNVASLAAPRALATATQGLDGRVLIAGGGSGSLTSPTGSASAELYDPVTQTFIALPPMATIRALHTATRLADGRILVTGGVADPVTSNATTSCQIFNPLTRTWSNAQPMNFARAAHSAELLADGRVLVVGGTPSFGGGATAIGTVLNASRNDGEVYNPTTNTWTAVSNTMASRRFLPSATRLADGRVLVVSGLNGATSFFGQELPTWTSTVDYYNPTTNTFSAAPGIGSSFARAGASALRLDNGDVVVAGGVISGLLSVPTASNSIRIFRNGNWVAGPNLPEAVALPGAVRLADGSALFVGGVTGTLLAPGASSAVARLSGGTLSSVASLPSALGAAGVVGLNDGSVLIAGGADNAALPSAAGLTYTPNL